MEQDHGVSFREVCIVSSVRRQGIRDVAPLFRCERPRNRLDRAKEDLTGLALSMFGKVTLLVSLHPPGGHQGAMLGLPGPAHVFGRAVAASANSSCSLAELKASMFFQAGKLPEGGELASLYGTEPS